MMCRILPSFVARHYEAFFNLPKPALMPINPSLYVQKVKLKILKNSVAKDA